MAPDSFRKRYFYKLITNILGFFISFLTVGIIPRSLGVSGYGNFTYISNFFTQVLSFFEFRTSTYYYVKLSQSPNDKKITVFYFSYAFILFLILSAFSGLLISIKPLHNFIFGSDSFVFYIVFSIFLVAVFSWFTDIISSTFDALGFTVYLEKLKTINKIVTAIALLLLYYFNRLNINTLVFFQLIIGFLVIFILVRFLLLKHNFINENLNLSDFLSYLKVFFKYSFPLLGYMILQFFGNVFDRWYLQNEVGSYEQGIYSFSYSLMNFCYLFINAFQPLVTREFSITIKENDILKLSSQFQSFNSILLAVTSYLCAYIFIEAQTIVTFFGGTDYLNSKLTLQILLLYPLISTYSLLNGAVLYATEKTKIFLLLSLIFTPVGIMFTFCFLNNSFGLGLGAKGLAIKNIIIDSASVLIILFLNSKFLKFSFLKLLIRFLYVIAYLLVAIISAYAASFFEIKPFYRILMSGSIYTVLIIILMLLFPKVLGLSSDHITLIKTKINEYYYKWFPSSGTN